jgi:hypothetical protein
VTGAKLNGNMIATFPAMISEIKGFLVTNVVAFVLTQMGATTLVTLMESAI